MRKTILTLTMVLAMYHLHAQNPNPIVVISSTKGDIVVELYPEQAPVTVANFLKYVDMDLFSPATFYRVVTMKNQPQNKVKIEVVQGGLWYTDTLLMLESIPHETTEVSGIKHEHGTFSMARNEPGSATSEFFICVNDQPSLDHGGLRNPDEQGFSAFGKVIKGMDIVILIHQSPNEIQMLTPPIEIKSIKRLD
jgi:peptidyl-prolyl cis-trans isomerase A (cyclophilin A)